MTFHPTNNPVFWQQTADTCLEQGRYEKAAEAYLRLAELTPNDAFAWKGRGKALLALERSGDAATCFERALLLLPDDEELLTLLSDALGKLGDVEKKTACFIRLGELEEQKEFQL